MNYDIKKLPKFLAFTTDWHQLLWIPNSSLNYQVIHVLFSFAASRDVIRKLERFWCHFIKKAKNYCTFNLALVSRRASHQNQVDEEIPNPIDKSLHEHVLNSPAASILGRTLGRRVVIEWPSEFYIFENTKAVQTNESKGWLQRSVRALWVENITEGGALYIISIQFVIFKLE